MYFGGKQMKKIVSTAVVILQFLLLGSICFCDGGGFNANITNQMLNEVPFSQEEIDRHFTEKFEEINKQLKSKRYNDKKNSSSDEINTSGSFYHETLVGYEPNYCSEDPKAFPLYKVYFYNTSGSKTYIDVNYNTSHQIAWKVSVDVSGEADVKFPLIKSGVKLKIGIDVEKMSSTTNAIGTSTRYNILAKDGYIPVYAPGINTGGAWKYEWWDVAGGHGYRYVYNGFVGVLPLYTYTYGGITFGDVVYTTN